MNSEILTQLFPEGIYRPFPTPRTVVVIPKEWDRHTGEEQQLLKRILGSIDQDLAAQIVVHSAVKLESLAGYGAEVVLVFGSEVDEDIPFYTEVPAAGFTAIRADHLSQFDDEKKKNLWGVLRKVFGK